MRSRYSAYALRDAAYLTRSWHPDTRPERVVLDRRQRWTGLEVLDRSGGGLFDSEGTVRFRARYTVPGGPGALVEESRFVRHEGAWVYLAAVQRPVVERP